MESCWSHCYRGSPPTRTCRTSSPRSSRSPSVLRPPRSLTVRLHPPLTLRIFHVCPPRSLLLPTNVRSSFYHVYVSSQCGSLVSSWYQLNDLDIPSLGAAGVQTLPDPPLTDLPVSLSLQPDQQVAVAVAICRADNLRPTVQVLIQSLAGALTQPSTSFPLTAPLTKVSSRTNQGDQHA